VLGALLCAVLLVVYRRNFYYLLPFYFLMLMAAALAIRAVYFALLASERLVSSNTSDVALIEMPTFLWFTAVTLLISFWFVVSDDRMAKRSLKWVAIIFAVVNACMYALLIAFIVVFELRKESAPVCQGTDPLNALSNLLSVLMMYRPPPVCGPPSSTVHGSSCTKYCWLSSP